MALEDCLQNPGVQVAIAGPKFKQAMKIVKFNMRKILKDMPKGLVKQVGSTWVCANGSVLLVTGFDTILETERGQDYYSIYMEETGSAKADLDEFEYMLYSVLFPTMQHSRGRLHHLTTPSRVVDHPLHTVTKVKCELANAFFRFTIEDNPLLSRDDIEKEIELLGGRGSVAVDRELFCLIRRDDAITILTTFDEKRHVAPLTHSPHRKYLIAGDMGYIDDKTFFLLMAWCHDQGKALIFAEKVFEPETPSAVIAESLKEWQSFLQKLYENENYVPTVVADIQGNTRTDLSTLGVQAMTPTKDLFESTVTYMRNTFYQDTALIDPACKLFIQTCRSGTFNKRKTDFIRNSVLGHCDGLMAYTYGQRAIDRTTDLRPKPKRSEVFILPGTEDPNQKVINQFRKLAL